MAESRKDLGAHFLFVAASLVVVVAGLKAASGLILPFVLSLFLAMVSLPLLNGLRSLRVPKGLAVVITLITVLLVLALVFTLVAGSLSGFTRELPKYQEKVTQMYSGVVAWLAAHGIEVPVAVTADFLNPGRAMNWVSGALSTVTGLLSNVFLVVLTIVFLLVEAAGFSDKMVRAFGRPDNNDRIQRIKTDVQRYLGMKTVISLVTGLVVWIALAFLGVDFPLLWGLLAFMANYIPSLGSIIAAVPPVLLALIELGAGRALAVALVFLAINVVLGNFLEPTLMGRRLGMSTLVVFLSLVFWGWVWGPVGMFLSVPLTLIVKIMLENTHDFRWVAVLLDSGAAAPPPASSD